MNEKKTNKMKDLFYALLIIVLVMLLLLWLFYDKYGDTPSTLFTYVVMTGLLLACLSNLPKILIENSMRNRLHVDGVECKAIINDVKKVITSFGQVNGKKINYSFEIGNKTYNGQQFLNIKYINKNKNLFQKEKTVSIVYLPKKPSINTLILNNGYITNYKFGE